ncbi:MAG TPA: hypothetical protein VM386_02715 [Acidimicrobiales bacterium]|nr:hypothetical protein [Acidimicrobiales bacterium]
MVVLVDVALDAEVDPVGRLLAATNVRRIAAHLGISKDTAARGLARLADAGLLARQDTKRSAAGEFVPSVYELHLGPGVGISLATPTPCRPSPCPAPEDVQAPPPPVTDIAVPDDDRAERAQPRSRSGRRTALFGQRALFELSDSSERQ